MSQPNPYECTSLAPVIRPTRSDLTHHVLAATPGITVVIVAATKYPVAAQSLDGAMAGSILVVVGYVVGRVLGNEPTSRSIGIFMSGAFAMALCIGWVDHPGGEATLWAFSCMSAGLLSGACGPSRFRDQPAEPIDVELLPLGEETSLRN